MRPGVWVSESGLTYEEIERLMSEDPDDRAIREAHGFSYEERDYSKRCPQGCGHTYDDIIAGKMHTCLGAIDGEVINPDVGAVGVTSRRAIPAP